MKETKNKKDKKDIMLMNVGIAGCLLIIGAGIGCFAGWSRAKMNDDYILKGILQQAVDNGNTELFWDSYDGTQTLKFLVNFVEEVKN